MDTEIRILAPVTYSPLKDYYSIIYLYEYTWPIWTEERDITILPLLERKGRAGKENKNLSTSYVWMKQFFWI